MRIEIKGGENFKFFVTRKIGLIMDETTTELSREAASNIEKQTKSKVLITSQSDMAVVSVISDKDHFGADTKAVSDAFEKLKKKVEPSGGKDKNILEIAGG
jgi:capsular polysaccharide biosynthesis protein